MDFTQMTGYEFEDYISAVLEQYGFSVTKTSYSHDGGIDLLAVYEKPLFAGKYLIQCKNWVGAVGQPEVRDLYGVVMSERANKGILIAPSDFTEQAYEFAKDKNIELVNGKILQTILDGVDLSAKPKAKSQKSKTFNYDQYKYLNNKIEDEPTEPQNYLDLIMFLRNYILNGDVEAVCVEEIFDKIVDLNERLMKRCYKSKPEKHYRAACQYRIAEIEIIRGNLGKATNILLDNGWFYLDRWYPQYIFKFNHALQEAELLPTYYRTLARNLYLSFSAIGCDFACEEQLKKPFHTTISIPTCIQTYMPMVDGKECLDFREYIYDSRKDYNTQYEELAKGIVPDIFYFALPKPSKERLSYDVCSPQTASISQFRKDYYKKSDVEILAEIEAAFRQHGMDN